MEQRITIKIAEKEYTLKAATPDHEEIIRRAADSVNKKITAFSNKFPGRSLLDIISFVALNESITSVSLQKTIDSMGKEAESLKEATDSYLKNIM